MRKKGDSKSSRKKSVPPEVRDKLGVPPGTMLKKTSNVKGGLSPAAAVTPTPLVHPSRPGPEQISPVQFPPRPGWIPATNARSQVQQGAMNNVLVPREAPGQAGMPFNYQADFGSYTVAPEWGLGTELLRDGTLNQPGVTMNRLPSVVTTDGCYVERFTVSVPQPEVYELYEVRQDVHFIGMAPQHAVSGIPLYSGYGAHGYTTIV